MACRITGPTGARKAQNLKEGEPASTGQTIQRNARTSLNREVFDWAPPEAPVPDYLRRQPRPLLAAAHRIVQFSAADRSSGRGPLAVRS